MKVEDHRGRKALLLGAAIVVAVLVVVAAIAAVPPRPGSSSTSLQPADAVGSSFAQHMLLIASGNVSSIVSQYEPNATIIWTGEASGGGARTGIYGTRNLGNLLEDGFGTFATTFFVRNVTQTIIAASNNSVVVNSNFGFAGQNAFSKLSGSVSAQDTYAFSKAAGAWLISRETWDFLSFDTVLGFCNEPCFPGVPASPQWVQNVAFSEDGNYLAAGATVVTASNGSVYLISLQKPTQGVLWRYVTGTFVSSVAISSDGAYVAAGGYWSGTTYINGQAVTYGHGEVFLLNKSGDLLWNVSTGSVLQAVTVAISANGSRIAAGYGSGLLYLNGAGDVLWNKMFQRGTSAHLAMSGDGRFIVYSEENVTLRDTSSLGWGVFYLDSQGRQLWNYTEAKTGASFVQMSGDGSHVAASAFEGNSELITGNGNVYYFDGRSGLLLWKQPYISEQGFVGSPSLVMPPDGSHIVLTGPTGGVLFYDSSGNLLWDKTDLGGKPVSVFQSDSIILMSGGTLVAYNGTVVASYNFPNNLSVVAGSQNGPVWVDVEGWIPGGGACANLHVNSATSQLATIELC